MTPPRWFRGCVTAWAIQFVIAQWIVAGIDLDTDEQVLAVSGG